MARVPSDPGIVTGRLDADGRLVAADPPLAALQIEAGASLGAGLALPQIAAIARLARQLGVPVARPAVAAGDEHDYDLWVRATPEGDEVLLALDGWRERVPAAPRLDLVLAADEEEPASGPATGEWATDAVLNLTALAPDLAERIGVGPDEAIGLPLTRFFRLEEDEQGGLPILAALASRVPFGGQRASVRGRHDVPLILSGEVMLDGRGVFTGFSGRAVPPPPSLALVGDDDEGLNGELDRALRSPLDRIIAAADRIVERSDGPLRSDYAGYASDIAAAGRHLLSVIKAMSDGAAAAERVDLAKCAGEAISLVASAAEAKRIAVDFLPTPLFAWGEPRGIVQVIVNILGNAVRYSPEGSRVMVSLAAAEGRARVTVADEGPGIAPEDQQRIFDRFERLGTSAPGTGLGLAIARRLAETMDGDILIESAPGEGARFTLDLPAA